MRARAIVRRWKAHWRPKFGFISAFVLLAAALVVAPFVYSYVQEKLPYPPGLDQDYYLAAGQEAAEHFRFSGDKPLYSAWMGAAYELSGGDLKKTFYLEKTASVLLLAYGIALLGLKLFGLRAAAVMGTWMLNAKYVLIESNGSHAFAAIILVAALISYLYLRPSAQLPVALLLMYLSTMVRPEQKVSFFFVLLIVVLHAANTVRSGVYAIRRPRYSCWVAVGIAAVSLTALFSSRAHVAPASLDELVFLGFSATYMERNDLLAKSPALYPGRWDPAAQQRVRRLVIPRAETSLDLVQLYPSELWANSVFKIKTTFLRVLPALLLVSINPIVLLVAIVGYALTLILVPEVSAGPRSVESRWALIIWCSAISLIIPVAIVLHVSARTYIQLVPVLIVLSIAIIRKAVVVFARTAVAREA